MLDSNSFSKAYFRLFAIHVRIMDNIQKFFLTSGAGKACDNLTEKGVLMKLQFYGSHLCPKCVESQKILKEKGIEYEFIDVNGDLYNLKRFLAFWVQEDIFKPFREQAEKPDYADEGRIGLPCFRLDNGECSMDLDYVLTKV